MKRDVWGIVSAIKMDREYLIEVEDIIETDCLPVLGMMRCCTIPHVAMVRWTTYVKSLNPDIWHISGKDSAMAYVLSRERFEDEVAESGRRRGSDRTNRTNIPGMHGT